MILLFILAYVSIFSGNFIHAILPTPAEIVEILKMHNDFRSNVKPSSNSMMMLKWHQEGAVKAEKMANKCIFEHDSSEDRATKEYPDGGGQNLFATNAPVGPAWKVAIKAWHDEVKLFTFGKDMGNFKQVGHYTQVVWGITRKIGCARSNCPKIKIYTCNYYPPGNFDPYFIPYRKSKVQTCEGCLRNKTCMSRGPYAGKLLDECGLFCLDIYSNCKDLANRNFCPLLKDQCALSCRKECKN